VTRLVAPALLAALALAAAVPAARAEQLRAPPLRAEHTLAPDQAASPAAARVVKLLLSLRDGIKETRYQHVTQIRRKDGFYAWDCSGMTGWILQKAAARSFAALRKKRASAADFYNLINKSPVGKRRRGWERLAHVSDVRPGDVFAFLRSPVSSSPVTGHVGFIIDTPQPVPHIRGMYIARVVDSTSYPHQHDSRGDGVTGFGFGTMAFLTDESGEAIAYGWYGTNSRGYLPTRIIFGRVW
jgi:hypothetical protein